PARRTFRCGPSPRGKFLLQEHVVSRDVSAEGFPPAGMRYLVAHSTLWYIGPAMADGSWLAQARRGVIELCVLRLIADEPRYGYQLATALAAAGKPLASNEGTLYPLLRRLQRDGYVDATWQESRDGPPRKYYHLTP